MTRTFGEMTSDEKHGLPPRGHGPVAPRPRLRQAGGGRALTSADARQAFGVYVHWPFCLSKCPYCDFNSHVRHAAIDEARFVARLRRARSRPPPRAHRAAPSRRSFFGGGTPSLMQPQTVGAILDAIGKHWTRRARRRGHARGQPDQRRGDALSRAIAPPASTASRSACRRSTTPR